MKAIAALYLLKRHGLVHQNLTLKDLKMIRWIWGSKDWKELVRAVMLTQYIAGDIDLTNEIRVPEVGFAIGGTMKLRLERIPDEDLSVEQSR